MYLRHTQCKKETADHGGGISLLADAEDKAYASAIYRGAHIRGDIVRYRSEFEEIRPFLKPDTMYDLKSKAMEICGNRLKNIYNLRKCVNIGNRYFIFSIYFIFENIFMAC